MSDELRLHAGGQLVENSFWPWTWQIVDNLSVSSGPTGRMNGYNVYHAHYVCWDQDLTPVESEKIYYQFRTVFVEDIEQYVCPLCSDYLPEEMEFLMSSDLLKYKNYSQSQHGQAALRPYPPPGRKIHGLSVGLTPGKVESSEEFEDCRADIRSRLLIK